MSIDQTVFERYEMKYMMMEEKYQELMKRLEFHMIQDEYGQHTICNIYYDTERYDLIRASIEKPVYKEKLRLRSYGVPKLEDPVFVELKKKYDGVVYKRRVKMPCQEATNCLMQHEPLEQSPQINKEINWFMTMYHPTPKVFLAYDRTALYGKEDSNLRITMDQRIRFREEDLDLSRGDWGEPLLEKGMVLMEVKISGAMPMWMSHLLAELKIYPASFSKYGACYKEALIEHMLSNKLSVARQEKLTETGIHKGGTICA